MTISEALLPEYDHEMATTRRLLELVPEARFEWRPHERSMTIGKLAGHLAGIPFWCTATLEATELDLDTMPAPATPATRADLLAAFDAKVAKARAGLSAASDPELLVPWTLKKGGQVFFTMPRISVIRSFVMNHSIHHRGQLSVYLRLNDVPLPPIYGPTADEQP
jgi:uncharacterized damage-inducible protein DinB